MGCPESLCSSASSQDLLKKSPNALVWPCVVQELELDARRLGPPAFLSLLHLCALPTFQSTWWESLFSKPYLPFSQVSLLLHCETLKEHRKILYFTLSVVVKKYSFSKIFIGSRGQEPEICVYLTTFTIAKFAYKPLRDTGGKFTLVIFGLNVLLLF